MNRWSVAQLEKPLLLTKRNNMLVLGSVGLAIDLAFVAISFASINSGYQGF